jgi:hypothetical protein
MLSPKSPCVKKTESELVSNLPSTNLLTPPSTNSSSPLDSKDILLPNNFKYYTKHLNKNQFNHILINCTIKLMNILYGESPMDEADVKFFMVEILKRSKTSIQTLQMTCYYLIKLIKLEIDIQASFKDAKKLFLGLLIISSKFNQDYNYSFKSWLKICGIQEDDQVKGQTFNLKMLKSIEFKCLTLLNYDIYINGLKYENWCNILIIFGYDFIKLQLVGEDKLESKPCLNKIIWETNEIKIQKKLAKWLNFFKNNLNVNNLNLIKINFNNYYLNQLGTKIIISERRGIENVPSLFGCGENCGKRSLEADEVVKRVKV